MKSEILILNISLFGNSLTNKIFYTLTPKLRIATDSNPGLHMIAMEVYILVHQCKYTKRKLLLDLLATFASGQCPLHPESIE